MTWLKIRHQQVYDISEDLVFVKSKITNVVCIFEVLAEHFVSEFQRRQRRVVLDPRRSTASCSMENPFKSLRIFGLLWNILLKMGTDSSDFCAKKIENQRENSILPTVNKWKTLGAKCERFSSVIRGLEQLRPTQMAYWAKHYVIVLPTVAHWMTY